MHQQGFSLIETLVSTLILSLGFLGLSALQTHTHQLNHSAFQGTQAVMLANFMMDSMRANKSMAVNGNYNLGTLSGDIPVCTTPSGTSLVKTDQAFWFNALKKNLGDQSTTCGLIACNAALCTVKVFWDDSRAGGDNKTKIEISSRL